VQAEHPCRDEHHGCQSQRDRGSLHDPVPWLRCPGCEQREGRGAGERKSLEGTSQPRPVRVAAEAPRQHEGRGDHRRVRNAADQIMHLVVPRLPGEARAGQEHVITPEQARGDRRRPRGLDQPRPGGAGRGDPAKSSTERNRAGTKDDEPGNHDLRIPRIHRSQPAELQPGGRITTLEQQTGHPCGSEQHWPGHSAGHQQPRATRPRHPVVPGHASLAAAEPSGLRAAPPPRPRESRPRHEPHLARVAAPLPRRIRPAHPHRRSGRLRATDLAAAAQCLSGAEYRHRVVLLAGDVDGVGLHIGHNRMSGG
jgi:hypothetical protein